MLWARKDVPKELRAIIGKTSLQKSLGTGDLSKARVIFHEVMRGFEARIADARARLANEKLTGFQPLTFTIPPEDLGMTPEMADAYLHVQSMKPENQMRETARRMEQKLVEAGLVRATPEAVSMEELFERWVRERNPRRTPWRSTNARRTCS